MQGQLAAHQLGFDEVVVQGKRLATQQPILVRVGWLPDLPSTVWGSWDLTISFLALTGYSVWKISS